MAESDRWGEHVDAAHGAVSVVSDGYADGVIVVVAGIGGVDQAEGLIPHGIAGEVDGDVPAAAFGLLFDQSGGGAEGAHVAGDEVVDQPGGRQLRVVLAAFEDHQPGRRRAVHVEAAAVGPWPSGSVAGDRDMHQPRMGAREFVRIDAELLQLEVAMVVDHDVGVT